MKIRSYEIIINKLPKVTAQSIFDDIEYEFRDNYDPEFHMSYEMSNKMFKEIKRLAKEDYDRWTEDSCGFEHGEDISYYDFQLLRKKLFGRVVFRVKTRGGNQSE